MCNGHLQGFGHGTESPDPDPQVSQICLLGVSSVGLPNLSVYITGHGTCPEHSHSVQKCTIFPLRHNVRGKIIFSTKQKT